MAEYAVLHLPPPARRADRRLQRLGADQDPTAAPRLSRQNLDSKQAAEAEQTPNIVLARGMPIKLIRPLARADAGARIGEDAWGVAAVGADKCPFDGAGCRVAVLDTGIDAAHSAFNGMMLEQCDFSGDGNGDQNGHGTHCAGTIFGRNVNGRRIGVARGITEALIGKVLDNTGGGSSLSVYEGLMWAISRGAHVIALSLGFDYPGRVRELVDDGWPVETATSRAIREYTGNLDLFRNLMNHSALRMHGPPPLIVAASGNESRRNDRADFVLAASLPSAVFHLSVGAVGRRGDRYEVADFSNAPPKVVAPGVDIVSAALRGGLAAMSGTSMSCPHVAGVAALWASQLASKGDEINAENLCSHLLHSASRELFVDNLLATVDQVGRGMVTAP